MAEYYAVERSPEYLAHFGVRGMKWGIRKQKAVGTGKPRSQAYTDAQKKLKRATMFGGVIGGLGYAATHKKEMRMMSNKSPKKASKSNALNKIRSNIQMSKDYMNSNKNLKRATMVGGIIGGAAYAAASHNNAPKRSQKLQNIGTSVSKKAVRVNNQREAYKNAMKAGREVERARNNLSFLGKHGFGKTAKAYREANINARNATNAYYNSLSKKQYAKLRRKHVG